MLIYAALSFLTGTVIGLRFNVKMVAHCAVIVVVLSLAAVIFGTASILEGVLAAIAINVALQAGYFASVILAAMGLVNLPEPVVARKAAKEPAALQGTLDRH